MKDGWYGDWLCAHDTDIDCPDYVDMAVDFIKRKISESFKRIDFTIDKEETILRKSGQSPYRLFDLTNPDPPNKGTIGWKGYFKFTPWMFNNGQEDTQDHSEDAKGRKGHREGKAKSRR